MKKFFGCLILGLLIGLASTSWNTCMSFYRTDVTELWEVPNNSTLCKIDTRHLIEEDPPNSLPPLPPVTGDNNQQQVEERDLRVSEEQYAVYASDRGLMIVSGSFSIPLADCPITEKNRDYEYSVVIKRPESFYPHFFTLVETDDLAQVGNMTHTKDVGVTEGAFTRTTVFVKKGDIRKVIARHWIFKYTVMSVEAIVALASVAFPNLAVIFNTIFISLNVAGMNLLGFEEFRILVALEIIIILAGLFVVFLLISFNKRFYLNFIGIVLIVAYLMVNSFLEKYWIAIIGVAALGLGWNCFEDTELLSEKYYLELGFAIAWIQQYQYWSTADTITLAELGIRLFSKETLLRGKKGTGDGFSLAACVWAGLALLLCVISACYWERKKVQIKKNLLYSSERISYR